MSKNYKHQASKKRRAELGKALNELLKLPQQKYRQGVNPNNGMRSST